MSIIKPTLQGYLQGLLIFLAIILPIKYCSAGEMPGIFPLPSESGFINNSSQSFNILKALLYESRRYYQKAEKVWTNFSNKNIQVRDHIFFLELASNLQIADPGVPDSDKSVLLMSRYLSWQKRWSQALEVLKNQDSKSSSETNQLEMIRLYLLLGKYKLAEQSIQHLGSMEHRERMQLEIYKTWLFILQGKKKEAVAGIKKLEDDYLYLPTSTMFPEDYLQNQSEQIKYLEISLVRFPSNEVLFEQLVRFLIKANEWERLKDLVRSQQFVMPTSIDWSLQAEIYLNTGQFDKLEDILKSATAKTIGPEYYDILARYAIEKKDWELLNHVAMLYQDRFPQLKDGTLFQIVYLEETGRKDEASQLLNQIDIN